LERSEKFSRKSCEKTETREEKPAVKDIENSENGH
jgi:hypothetical protein